MRTQGSKLTFKGQNIYVGLDVHKKSWNVTIMTEAITHKTFTQPPKPEILYEYLRRNFPEGTFHSAYEAGFCGFWIHNKLISYGIKSIVVNPADIPTTNKEMLQKDDPRDSRKIARALCSGQLTPIYTPSQRTLEDRAMVRTRSILVKDSTRNKNRIKSFLFFHGIEIPEQFSKAQSHWSKPFLNWLESQDLSTTSGRESLNALLAEVRNLRNTILNLTKAIQELSKNENYRENVVLLRSIPGIGLLTAMTILVEIEDIHRFSNSEKLASFVGLIPTSFSSGEKEVIGNITSRGNGILKRTIIESAWVTARLDPALMHCYNDYRTRMEPNKAIIKIARKLLNRIRYVLINKRQYEVSKME